ncbi:chitin binding [Ascochyta rabiei]|uniref:Chitin binding n=2 Tax=Didymella rabiei TaxID=5454 RepID=A0A163KK17_DIDRA|nr:chitin binding [Ascochyta rabiei]
MRSVSLVVNLAIVTLPGLVSAANNIKMINRCPYDIYSWSVGPVGSGFNGHDHEALTIPANSVTVHGMINTEAIGSGIALKFRDLSKYEVAPAGIIQVEYNLEPSKNNLWYDLSAIDCDRAAGPESPSFCPLVGGGMKLYVAEADEAKCPPAWCGADGCHNTYTRRGSWKGEPTFRCNVGVDIIIEMCTERAGARTFNGNTEPEHAVDSNPDVKAGGTTQNGVCGARDPFGATCFGYTHGNCCSSYGWCGFSEAHCGDGCQAGFGDCFSSGPVYQPPAQLPAQPSYSNPEPNHVEAPPSYAQPTPDHVQPTHTHHEQTWPIPSYDKPTFKYAGPSTFLTSYIKPTLSHSKSASVYSAPTPSYNAPGSSSTPPVHTKPSHGPVYTPPAYTPAYPPAYSPPPYRTIYTTHILTKTQAQLTRTVAVSTRSNAPTTISPVYHAPPQPPLLGSAHTTPSYTHPPQQDPHVSSTRYNAPVPTPVQPVYYHPITKT